MPRYVTEDDVLSRLKGKVRVTDNVEEDEGIMPRALLLRLISEAEAQAEYDLSERYSAPFEGYLGLEGAAYDTLPASPTRVTIRRMVSIQACIYILETDFGAGTIVDGSKYREQLEKQYKAMVEKQLEKRDGLSGGTGQYRHPPLPGLRLSVNNEVADDGSYGTVLVTSQGDGDYPQQQINDPSETIWTGRIDR